MGVRGDDRTASERRCLCRLPPPLHREVSFAKLPGVVKTRVGYTGGKSSNPTYETVCRGDGHTEALRIW